MKDIRLIVQRGSRIIFVVPGYLKKGDIALTRINTSHYDDKAFKSLENHVSNMDITLGIAISYRRMANDDENHTAGERDRFERIAQQFSSLLKDMIRELMVYTC